VYAFAEDVAASGGQWLLAAAPTAGSYALPTSIVGSIGVVSPSFGAVRALERLGLERRLYRAGTAKGGLDPFSPIDPAEERRMNEVLSDLHSAFVAAVRDARGPALAAAPSPLPDEDLFSGRVWTGRQAAAAGLVDGCGSLVEVMTTKLGPDTRFVECGERVPAGAGLFGGAVAAWLAARGRSGLEAPPSSSVADAVAGVPAAVLAALEERAAYEQVGAGGAWC
jgi:serine protease SohB